MYKASLYAGVLVLAMLMSGCTNYIKKGDSAAATGDWKAAVESYKKAIKKDPNAKGLKQKYEDAKSHAIEQSFQIAKRCQTEEDPYCVENETSYILELDPANSKAAELRKEANRKASLLLVEEASHLAKSGEFLRAIQTISAVRSKCRDEDIMAKADNVVLEMANPAVEYVETTMKQEPPSDPRNQIRLYADLHGVLSAVIQHAPDHQELLADLKSRLQAARELEEKQRQERIAAKKKAREESRKKREEERANRSRTVSFVGALINLNKADGTEWDGLGKKKVSADAIKSISGILLKSNPYAAAVGILSGPIAATTKKPDVSGRLELFVNNRLVYNAVLGKRQDSYTPQWQSVIVNNVDINNAYIKVSLIDRDLANNDDMGVFEITSEDLKSALEAGDVHPVPVWEQTNKQVLFALISVK